MILHLESVSWQTVASFPEAFPNLFRLMPSARVFRAYFSSATSTQMAIAYLLHANDFELDAAAGLTRPAANNPSLFACLQRAGYHAAFLCVTALQAKAMLPLLADSLPPAAHTDDFGALFERFDAATATAPFAVYVWNLVTHIEHAAALAAHAGRIDELVGGACAVADHALGRLLDILARKNRLDDTTIVVFGDHGDDYWTHGFKKGLLHGVEPYTHIVHTPLLIRDASLPAGSSHDLASTIDIAPTCLALLGVPAALPFTPSGHSLAGGAKRGFAFSQNFAANQADGADWDIRRAFSVSDDSYSLLVSSRGLELFNHRLDPTNHCNLLHFFDLDAESELVLRAPDGFCHSHFAAGMRYMMGREKTIARDFRRLREALAAHVGRKRAYVAAQAPAYDATLDPACLRTVNREGYDRFFAAADGRIAPAAPAAASLPDAPGPAPSLLGGIRSALFGTAGRRRGR